MNPLHDNTYQNDHESLAQDLSKALDHQAQRLDMRTLKRLEEGRERALKRHAEIVSGLQVQANGTLTRGIVHYWHVHRYLLGGLMGLMLLLVLGSILHNNKQADSIDAFILASELPPEAFVDRGFEPWLNAKAEL